MAWHLSVGGTELTGLCEWGATVEETLGGSGVTSFVIQSRDVGMFSDPATFARKEVLAWLDSPYLVEPGQLTNGVWYLFRGLVQTVDADFPVGMPWGRYTFHCKDYAGEILDKHYVGIPISLLKVNQDGTRLYGNRNGSRYGVWSYLAGIDPKNAALYRRLGGKPPPPEHDGYVSPNPYFEKSTLRSALDTMAGYSGGNTQYWWDAAGIFHWTVILRWWEADA